MKRSDKNDFVQKLKDENFPNKTQELKKKGELKERGILLLET